MENLLPRLFKKTKNCKGRLCTCRPEERYWSKLYKDSILRKRCTGI